VVKIIPRLLHAGVLIAPTKIPEVIAMIKESELPPSSAVSDAGVVNPATLFTALGPVSTVVPPPLPIEKKAAPPTARIRVGGVVQSAKLVRQPRPVYPELAKRARIQGAVKLHALISKEGIIEDLRVMSGHPLLVPAALEAVKQWVYQPTLLNGEAVGVETDIDVNFMLQ
jgi:protein TonB